jgi:serine/threonine-protein kinase
MEAVFQAGDVLRGGRYEIQRHLRQAHGKQVYLAIDHKTDSRVALDVYSNNATMPSGLSVSAWEAKVLGNLGDHPNIGHFIEHWEDDDTAVMVSRYWGGGRLSDRLRRNREAGEQLTVDEIFDLGTQIADGVAHIHGRRILYRDLDPHNVLFDERGNIHLVDFDIAVSLDDPEHSAIPRRAVRDYMAPEAISGDRLDERADLFSLGATIHAMCCGGPPSGGHGEGILAERDDISDGLRELVGRLLAADPEHRPASAHEVVERLHELRDARTDLERLLRSDESKTLEFKASLRTPVAPREHNASLSKKELQKAVEHSAIKTLAAFLNSDGGVLIIGVEDDGKVTGIEVDWPRVSASRDGWRRALDQLVSRHLGTDAMRFIDVRLEPWDGRTVAVIHCRPRDEPTWLDDQLFVRRTASTKPLDPRRTVSWYLERWGRRQPEATHAVSS